MKATHIFSVNHRSSSVLHHTVGIANCKEILKHWKQSNTTYLCVLYKSTQSHNTWRTLPGTQHIQRPARACVYFIMHTTNTHTRARYAIHATHKYKDTRTHSPTRKDTHTYSQIKGLRREGTVQTCWTKAVCFVIQFQVLVQNTQIDRAFSQNYFIVTEQILKTKK